MKNLVKLSLLTVGIALSSSLMAQEEIKKDAISTADKLEAPKPADTKTDKQEPAKATKQEPVKSAPAPAPSGGASKTESKSDTSSGTRMAITEQGMPKKNKRKAAANTTTPPPTPPKK